MEEVTAQSYKIGEKEFQLQTDFTYEELEWIDVVYNRLTASPSPKASGSNEINGSFTRDEIKKTLKILLPGFTDEDFMKTRESLSVKIIADFFLTKAILGTIIKN